MRLVQVFVNCVCAIADNWFYLGRIGLYKWTSPAEEHLMTMIATGTALVSIAIDLGTELGSLLAKRASDPDFSVSAHLRSRFLYLLGKLLDIPVSTPSY